MGSQEPRETVEMGECDSFVVVCGACAFLPACTPRTPGMGHTGHFSDRFARCTMYSGSLCGAQELPSIRFCSLQDTFYTEEIVDARDVYRSSVEVNDCKDVVFAPVRLKHKPLSVILQHTQAPNPLLQQFFATQGLAGQEEGYEAELCCGWSPTTTRRLRQNSASRVRVENHGGYYGPSRGYARQRCCYSRHPGIVGTTHPAADSTGKIFPTYWRKEETLHNMVARRVGAQVFRDFAVSRPASRVASD